MLVFVTMIQAGMILFFFMGTTMAWLSSPLTRTKISAISRFLQAPTDHNGFSTWTESDDWSILSMENERNSSPDSESLYNQDLAWNTARDFEAITQGDVIVSQEDAWIGSIVDEIHNSFATLEEDHPPLYDSSFDEAATMTNAIDAMGNEIALLVRCNQHPEDLLIAEGRALPPLTDAERNDVSQLVRIDGEIIHATEFLKESISRIFHQHATANPVDGALCLDRIGVASWMTKSLKTEEGRVSAHDSRVLKTLSDFSSYGSGRLLEENLEDLYLTTIVGKKANERVSLKRHLALRQPYVDAVWRDIRNHGILAPVEQERNRLKEAITVKSATSSSVSQTIMDECEILDWNYLENDVGGNSADRKTATKSKSSHKLVEMAPNTKTPLWMRDGDFVFIDEESCIGCMQCANVSPDSFLMLESGRARTFEQRHTSDVKQAVASCPVNCMHPVTFEELQEYETARDEGDGRSDHKHLGHRRGPTPLYVAGIDSDNNHRTSWYHTLKGKCVTSSQCPQKGCYDCPRYSKPGENPYFQKHQKDDNHVRAQYFIEQGDVDIWRKTAEL